MKRMWLREAQRYQLAKYGIQYLVMCVGVAAGITEGAWGFLTVAGAVLFSYVLDRVVK